MQTMSSALEKYANTGMPVTYHTAAGCSPETLILDGDSVAEGELYYRWDSMMETCIMDIID